MEMHNTREDAYHRSWRWRHDGVKSSGPVGLQYANSPRQCPVEARGGSRREWGR